LRIVLGLQSHELEEQWQRTRRGPLLQCGIGGC
jgi:hypothetical protein